MKDRFSQLVGDYSSKWHAQFLDNLPVGIFRTTVEGSCVFCNRILAKMLGFKSAKELLDYPVIKLYQNRRDRGNLVQNIIKYGHLENYPAALQKKDGSPIHCSSTIRAVLDDDGMVIFLDGILFEKSGKRENIEKNCKIPHRSGNLNDFFVILDQKENFFQNVHYHTGTDFDRDIFVGKSLISFIEPQYRDLFALFINDILLKGSKKGVVKVMDRSGTEHHIAYKAVLTDQKRDYELPAEMVKSNFPTRTDRQFTKGKLAGVKEMAGGVSHKLNQPLTLINNYLSEILSEPDNQKKNYRRILKVQEQINKLIETVKKISSIKKYETMEYVAGIKIVDIDKAT